MVHIHPRHVHRGHSSGPGLLGAENAHRGRLLLLHGNVPPRVDFGAEVELHAGVAAGLALQLVIHHGLEVGLDGVQAGSVVDIDVAVPLRDFAAEVVEEGLSFVDGLDVASVKIRGHDSGGRGRRLSGGVQWWRPHWLDPLWQGRGRRY